MPAPIPDLVSDNNIPVIAASNDGTPPRVYVKESLNLRKVLQDTYHKDTICSKILAHLEAHPRFRIHEGLIWTKNQLKWDVLYIPKDIPKRKEAGRNHYQPHMPSNWPL